eukprot:TRINITY_DN561_c0_g1_i1.p1 TRINITY_DN561_c0_g1~~TRINITY_DN561_c0_g1_i1.p1  ORF type:complete len:707 (-),score=188.75 TRINITY_DN561_c0_g1_i1:30-2150(-)
MDESQEFHKFTRKHTSVHQENALLVANTKGIIVSANQDAHSLFGFEDRELIGKNVSVICPQPYSEQHDSYIETYLLTKQPKVIGSTRIVIAKAKTNETFHVRLSVSHAVVSGKDYFTALLERVVDRSVTMMIDDNGICMNIKGNLKTLFGYNNNEVEGKTINVLMPPNISRIHDNLLIDYNPSSKVQRVVGKVRNVEAMHKSGYTFPISLQVNYDEQQSKTLGKKIFVGKIEDVEEDIEALVTVTVEGVIKSASSTFWTLFGYQSEELEGKHISMVVDELGTKELLHTKEGVQIVKAKHKDTSSFFVSLEIHQFESEGIQYYRGLIKRINRRKKNLPEGKENLNEGQFIGPYVIEKTLGSGFFGEVKRAQHKPTAVSVAIKTLRKQQYEESKMKYPPREIKLLEKLTHPNICKLFEVIEQTDRTYLITELITGGELFDYIAHVDHVTEQKAREMFRQMVSAVAYMHSIGIVHRDLKMENMMLDDKGNVKIIDLGLGNFYDTKKEGEINFLGTFCGSADYAAPELWEGCRYKGPEVDIWSLGVILYILTTGFLPFNDSTRIMAISYRWPKSVHLTDPLKNLISRIFVPSDKRISMHDVIHHPWLNMGHESIVEITPLSTSVIDQDVIRQVEKKFGYRAADVQKSLETNEKNQFSMTYWILKDKKENKIKDKRSDNKKEKNDKEEKVKESKKNSGGDHHDENSKCNLF